MLYRDTNHIAVSKLHFVMRSGGFPFFSFAKTARPNAYNAMPVNSGVMHRVKICLWLKKMQMWMNAGFTGKTLSNATLCLKNQNCL